MKPALPVMDASPSNAANPAVEVGDDDPFASFRPAVPITGGPGATVQPLGTNSVDDDPFASFRPADKALVANPLTAAVPAESHPVPTSLMGGSVTTSPARSVASSIHSTSSPVHGASGVKLGDSRSSLREEDELDSLFEANKPKAAKPQAGGLKGASASPLRSVTPAAEAAGESSEFDVIFGAPMPVSRPAPSFPPRASADLTEVPEPPVSGMPTVPTLNRKPAFGVDFSVSCPMLPTATQADLDAAFGGSSWDGSPPGASTFDAAFGMPSPMAGVPNAPPLQPLLDLGFSRGMPLY
jgi:hypothetical protein